MASDSEMESLRRELRDLVDALGGFRGEVSNTTRSTREMGDAAEGSANEISAEADVRRANAEVDKKDNEAKRNRSYALDRAYQDSENAVKSLTKSFISGEAGFSKYNSGISSAGDAAFNFGKSLGPLGAILGGVVKGATMVAEAAFKQADNLLKASDQISKMGAANAFSTEQIRQMGAKAGLASDQLDTMLKPLAGMTSGMRILGNTQAEGVKRFADMVGNVDKKTRQEFLRLGLGDTERIQAQADFVDMLAKTGSSLQGRMKTEKGLAEASLVYTKNLYELSNITGKNIEESKKDIELSRATYEWGLAQYKYQRDIKAATEKGTPEGAKEADRLQKELNSFNTMLAEAQARGGQKEAAALAQRIVTKGASTAETSFYDQKGQDINKLIRGIQGGEQYTGGTYTDQAREAESSFIDRMSIQQLALNKEFGESVLSLQNLNDTATGLGKSAVGAVETVTTALTDNQQGKGPAAEDLAQIAREELVEAERLAKVALDGLLASVNPLTQGFNDTTIAVTALAVAAGLAVTALGLSTAGSVVGSVGGAVGAAGGALGAAGAAAVGGAGGVLAAGAGGYLAGKALVKASDFTTEMVTGRKGETLGGVLNLGGADEEDLAKYDRDAAQKAYAKKAAKGEKINQSLANFYTSKGVKVDKSLIISGKDKGGPIKPGEISLVGEFGPELLAGPGMVTSRKDTEAILMKAMQGITNPGITNPGSNPSNQVFSTATMRTQQLTKERKLRDLMEEKEVELDQVASLNMTLGILNDSAIELSEVFYEVEEQLRSIFGTEDSPEPADPTTIVDKVKAGLDKLFGGGGTGEGAPPVVPSDMSNLKNPEKIKAALAYFEEQGWSREQSAGILGNLMAESGSDLKTNAVGDGGKAFGIAQWHPDRQAMFKKQFNKDIRESTLEEQLGFVDWELKNTEHKAGGMLSQARSEEQAAAMVDKYYERSSGAHRGKRMSYAAGLMQAFPESEEQVASATPGATAEAMKKAEDKPETKPAVPSAAPTFTTNYTDSTAEMMKINAQILDSLGVKLDTMIAKLDDSNTIQEKILRQSA